MRASHFYHVARSVASETENGNVAVQVAVEEASVPVSGPHAMDRSPPDSDVVRSVTTVPSGILAAAMATVAGLLVLI